MRLSVLCSLGIFGSIADSNGLFGRSVGSLGARCRATASAVSHVVMEEDGRTIRVSAEGEQVQPVGSAIDLEALEDVAVVAVTDDGRELVFAVAPNKGRELQFAMGPDGSSDHEVANCP